MNGQILRSLKETILFEHPTYIGGGTDIMPLLKNGVRDDCELVFLKKIPELRELTDAESYLVIGSGMTLTELAENKLVNERCTAVAQAASLTASPQIRNIATIGGNIMQDRRCIYFNQTHLWRSGLAYCFKTGGTICHQIPNSPVCRAIYYSDVATALIACDAEVEYIENGEIHRESVETLIARHTVTNGLPATNICRSWSHALLYPVAKRVSAQAFINMRCARRSTSRLSTLHCAAAAAGAQSWSRVQSRRTP